MPSEAEWALAARGREGRRFPWGDAEPSCDQHIFGRAPDLACARSGEGPMAVGASGDVTAQGVRGLGGNVREWVADVFEGDRRVVRGGGWLDQPVMLRAARRGSDDPSWADPAIGFRCAR